MEEAFNTMKQRLANMQTELLVQRSAGAQQQVQDAPQQCLLAMEGELLAVRAANAQLQAQVSRAAAATPAQRSVVDTKGFGKPGTFDGTAGRW